MAGVEYAGNTSVFGDALYIDMSTKMQRTLKSFFGKVPRHSEPVDGSLIESVPQDLGNIQDVNNLPDVDLTGLLGDVFHDSPQHRCTYIFAIVVI